MQFTLNIRGVGAVSPAGVGQAKLLDGTPPHIQPWTTLSSPVPIAPAAMVDMGLPCWARWRTQPRLRRASSLTLFLIEAVDEAIRQADLPAGMNIGLSVVFANGVLGFTRKFYEGVAHNGAAGANPSWFPETVFNAPLNHVLGTLGRTGPSSAWVGDASSFAQAWLAAGLWLEQGEVDAVVVAAAEEVDEAMMEVSRDSGWYNHGNNILPAEGAAAFVVTGDSHGKNQGRLHIHPGRPWGCRAASANALAAIFADFDPGWPVYSGSIPPPGPARQAWKTCSKHRKLTVSGPDLGYAHSLSAGWAFLRLLASVTREKPTFVLPLEGAGHQVAALGWESLHGRLQMK